MCGGVSESEHQVGPLGSGELIRGSPIGLLLSLCLSLTPRRRRPNISWRSKAKNLGGGVAEPNSFEGHRGREGYCCLTGQGGLPGGLSEI